MAEEKNSGRFREGCWTGVDRSFGRRRAGDGGLEARRRLQQGKPGDRRQIWRGGHEMGVTRESLQSGRAWPGLACCAIEYQITIRPARIFGDGGGKEARTSMPCEGPVRRVCGSGTPQVNSETSRAAVRGPRSPRPSARQDRSCRVPEGPHARPLPPSLRHIALWLRATLARYRPRSVSGVQGARRAPTNRQILNKSRTSLRRQKVRPGKIRRRKGLHDDQAYHQTGRVRTSALPRIDDDDARALEIPNIARHHGQAVNQRGCRNQRVGLVARVGNV